MNSVVSSASRTKGTPAELSCNGHNSGINVRSSRNYYWWVFLSFAEQGLYNRYPDYRAGGAQSWRRWGEARAQRPGPAGDRQTRGSGSTGGAGAQQRPPGDQHLPPTFLTANGLYGGEAPRAPGARREAARPVPPRPGRCHGSANARPSPLLGRGHAHVRAGKGFAPSPRPWRHGEGESWGDRALRPPLPSQAELTSGPAPRGRRGRGPPLTSPRAAAVAGPRPLVPGWTMQPRRYLLGLHLGPPQFASSPRAGTGAGPVAGLRLSSARAAAALALSPARPPSPPPPGAAGNERIPGRRSRRHPSHPLPCPAPPPRAAAPTCRRAERPRRRAPPPGCPAPPGRGPSGNPPSLPPEPGPGGARSAWEGERGGGRGPSHSPPGRRRRGDRRGGQRGAAAAAAAPCERTRRRTWAAGTAAAGGGAGPGPGPEHHLPGNPPGGGWTRPPP